MNIKLNERQIYFSILLAVLFAGVYLRYRYMLGTFMDGDELNYISRATDAVNGELDPSSFEWYDYRLLVYLPQSALNSLLGFGPFRIILWPFIVSVLHICVVYRIALILFISRRSVVLSTLLMALAPLNLIEIRLLPDAIFAFMLSVVVLFLLKSERSESTSGFLINISLFSFVLVLIFFVRENAFLIMPFIVIFLLFYTENYKRYLPMLSVFLGAIVLLGLITAFFYDADDSNRLVTLYSIIANRSISENITQIAYLPYLHYLHHQLVFGYGMAVVFCIGSAYLLIVKDRAGTLALIWFITVYIYFEFLSPLHGLRPAEGSFRYATPFIAPMALVTGRFCDKWYNLDKENDPCNFRVLIPITIAITFIIQHLLGNLFSLVPAVFLFLYGKKCKVSAVDTTKKMKKISILPAVIMSALLCLSIIYTATASMGYDRITLNNLNSKIHGVLRKWEKGLIHSNDFLVERKQNLYLNHVLVDRQKDLATLEKYLVVIRPDLLKVAYRSENNDHDYDLRLMKSIDEGQYVLVVNNPEYRIYEKK